MRGSGAHPGGGQQEQSGSLERAADLSVTGAEFIDDLLVEGVGHALLSAVFGQFSGRGNRRGAVRVRGHAKPALRKSRGGGSARYSVSRSARGKGVGGALHRPGLTRRPGNPLAHGTRPTRQSWPQRYCARRASRNSPQASFRHFPVSSRSKWLAPLAPLTQPGRKPARGPVRQAGTLRRTNWRVVMTIRGRLLYRLVPRGAIGAEPHVADMPASGLTSQVEPLSHAVRTESVMRLDAARRLHPRTNRSVSSHRRGERTQDVSEAQGDAQRASGRGRSSRHPAGVRGRRR